MEAGTIAPGASAEEQERQRKMAEDAEGGAVEHDARGADADGFEESPEQEAEDDLLELSVEGDGQLTLTVGGAKPDTSVVKLSASKISVDGGDFDKGQELKFLVHGVVGSVEFKDHRDQHGNLSGTERIHKVRAMRVERLKS